MKVLQMNPSLAVYRGLKCAGINLVTSVPCVNLQELLALVGGDPDIIHLPVTREEEGVGICAGAWMGGLRPTLLMQNSGLGNCINALASLYMLYAVPLLMIISHRGGVGEPIIGQVPMGRLTVPLLDAMNISHYSPNPDSAEETVARAWERAARERKPAAVLLDLDFWRAK
jgi:sulfopyruvate decarboxylase subunit alpha